MTARHIGKIGTSRPPNIDKYILYNKIIYIIPWGSIDYRGIELLLYN